MLFVMRPKLDNIEAQEHKLSLQRRCDTNIPIHSSYNNELLIIVLYVHGTPGKGQMPIITGM